MEQLIKLLKSNDEGDIRLGKGILEAQNINESEFFSQHVDELKDDWFIFGMGLYPKKLIPLEFNRIEIDQKCREIWVRHKYPKKPAGYYEELWKL